MRQNFENHWSSHCSTGTNPSLTLISVGPYRGLPDSHDLEKFLVTTSTLAYCNNKICSASFEDAYQAMELWKAKWGHTIVLTNISTKTRKAASIMRKSLLKEKFCAIVYHLIPNNVVFSNVVETKNVGTETEIEIGKFMRPRPRLRPEIPRRKKIETETGKFRNQKKLRQSLRQRTPNFIY